MKRIAILITIVCLLSGVLSGCIHAAAGENTPDTVVPGFDAAVNTTDTETAAPTEETAESRKSLKRRFRSMSLTAP